MSAAERIARAIQRNVDDLYANRVTWEQFDKKQTELWAAASISRVADQVLELVCPPAGPLTRKQP
jgi:hypothetical protein